MWKWESKYPSGVIMAVQHLQTLIVCAFRYALGRATYVVSIVVKEIHSNWRELREADRELIVREILEHKERHGKIGHEMDEREWMTIVERYRTENGMTVRKD